MKISDFPEDIEPRVGDILEIEQGDVCFEVRIIGITADGYLCEQDNVQGAVLLEGVDLDHGDVADITGYIAEEKVRLDPKCWKGKKIGNPKTKMKGGVRVNNCVPEGQEDIEESGLQYYTGVKKHGEKYMKLAAKAGREGASQEELGRLRDRYSKAEKTKESVEQDVAEAGPFSYGAKKPRKGSVAYNDLMKRKEQDRKRVKDIEAIGTKNHHVGVAKVTKAVSEGTESQYVAARYIDEFGDGYHWYVKGTPDVIKKFVLLANSLEDETVKGTEYEPGKGMMGGIHAELGNDAAPQWTTVPARNLESIKPIGDKVLQRLMRPNLADGAQEFMSELLWAMEAKGLALIHDDSQPGVAEDISSTKKKISKYEELALAANRAGDDAKCKQYQQKIQVLKQKMSQGVAEGYTGRETKDGTWRVFKDGQAVAVAGPFNSRDEAHAWIKKHKQGVSEAKSLKKRVRVVQGEHAGKTGWIREIKHGVHSTAPKRYYVDIDGGGQADNLPASALRLLKDQSDGQTGMAEATGDKKFDAMMGNIKKSAPVPVSGYVAVEYASENKSDRIKGATLKGKPMPSSVDRDDLDGEIEFEPDEIERHLIKIGRDNGWSIIDPGHGRGYSELFFDTNANYTSDNQSILAKNIVNTVNQINKFFNGLNSSLQSTGLPGYKVAVWQEISSSNGEKIGDIDQIKQIALNKVVNSPNDPGELIGKAILRELPAVEQDEYDDFTPEDFAYARKIAKIYITKGERAGLEAQISNRRMDHVSDLIDELLSLSGAQKYRTLKLDDLDEQGVAEGSLETDNMVSHIGQVIQSIYPRGGDKKTYMKLVAREMPRIVKANPKLFRRAFSMAYDRFFHIDQDDDFDYTDYSMRKGERGMAEVRGNIDADQAGFYVVDEDGNAVSGPFASKQEAYERAAEMGRMYDVKYKGDIIPLDSLISKIIKTLPPDVTSDDLQDPMDLEQQLEILRSPLLKVFSKLSPYEQAEVTDEVANHFYDRRFGDLDEEKQKGVDGKACWKGYKRMGTKKKGGRTVDNCVKVGEDAYSESLMNQLNSIISEKAPPGDKYERMVKHIKKGYAKDGKISDKERSIAYATAWKAKNKAKK